MKAPVVDRAAGVEGNGRLIAVNGMILLVGPVLLKCASTCYRFVRYYTGARPYLDNGPPHLVLRVLGPVVILTSLTVLGTGIGLIYTGPDHRDPLLTLHKASFVVWFAAMTIHVLGHLLDGARTTWHEVRDPHALPEVGRRRWRILAVGFALLAGVGLASTLLPSAHAWTSRHSDGISRHDDR